MNTWLEILKALLIGLVEGITEWLPVSSTGHLILLDEWVPLQVSDAFLEMFHVVIQLGAILAVIVLYFRRLNPFSRTKTEPERKRTWGLWLRVVVSVIPSAVVGLLLDDWLDAHLYNYLTVSVTLILYGIIFLFIEKVTASDCCRIDDAEQISCRTAFFIGLFQVLALIPGTSRSGSTIIGAMLLGLSRTAAAEFSFFMAIPTMAGASLLKIVKFIGAGVTLSGVEWAVLAVGCVTAFLVSVLAIRFLTDFVKKHSFRAFGVYRIILGIGVVLYFLLSGL